MPITRRRVVLASGLALLSGCTSGETEQTREGTSITKTRRGTSVTETRRETATTETQQENTTTQTSKPDVLDPDVNLQFGESHVDTDLEITVDSPTIETEFESDGETHEMPEGEALAFAHIEFYNTHSDEMRPIDGPIFTLVDDETPIIETHSVEHPDADPSIRTRNVDDIPTTGRWGSHGSVVDSDERRHDTAVFEVAEAIDPSGLSIAYESDRIHDDRFGDKVVEWSR